jgi:pepF/M3 family oligoendopeptidase
MTSTGEFALTWELDSLYPHPETDEFSAVLKAYRSDLETLAADSEQLPAVGATSADVWADFLDRWADLFARTEDLHAFIGCHAAADAENKLFQKLEGVLTALGPQREQVLTNLELALRDAAEQQLQELIDANERLQTLRFYLEDSARNAAFRLSKDQELLTAELAVDAIHAWGRLYDRVSGELRIEVMEKGELVRKSVGQVHFDSPERNVRQNNFYAADKAWRGIADTCADALNHISGFRLTRYRRLGVQDHLDLPLRFNRMRRETLETMWRTITERKEMLLQYFSAKARRLGLEKLCWYDLLAPVGMIGAGKELPYDDACRLVIKTFSEFSDELGEFASRALNQRWIEVENRPGKRQGGFCTGFPTKKQSRIFMTYTNSPDSMSTLAHELGHAYHSYVLRDQPYFLREYPMNLAETASTFAEAVLGERRLADAASDGEKISILDNMLGDAMAFLMNIHARFIFEHNFHVERADGELTADRFSELMLAAQKEAYLDGLDPDGWYPGFWISKLHFYISGWPFYNFPYTFGYLLSQGVYSLAADGGPDFPEQYRRLLIATGCMQTEEAVASTFGFDLTQPAFWNRGLDIVEGRVREFLRLTET